MRPSSVAIRCLPGERENPRDSAIRFDGGQIEAGNGGATQEQKNRPPQVGQEPEEANLSGLTPCQMQLNPILSGFSSIARPVHQGMFFKLLQTGSRAREST